MQIERPRNRQPAIHSSRGLRVFEQSKSPAAFRHARLDAILSGVTNMTDARIVLTTIGDEKLAETLATKLVERRLAACVNIVGPIRSVYRWRGAIEREQEFLLIIKTTREQATQLPAALRELHSYELPECVEVVISGGSQEYLAWLSAEVVG